MSDPEPPWQPWPAAWRKDSLPWLSRPGIALIVVGFCLPFVLVRVPPLIDLPGHMGAAAIEQAGPHSPLARYFAWRWMFTLNLGGEVLMKAVGMAFGTLAAGWISAVLATALLAGGCLATMRTLNPRGAWGAPWALMFVFAFPLLTGFINYTLAAGIALAAFAAAVALVERPRARVALLVAAQPLALVCHAIGGLLLPLLVGCHALGQAIEQHGVPWRAGWRRPGALGPLARAVLRQCWPLVVAVAIVLAWKLVVPANGGLLRWRWEQKAETFLITLRDQSFVLDIVSTMAAFLLAIFAHQLGARWGWARLLPGLAVLGLFLVIPSDINGSAFVDTRLLPVAAMLLLGLADWSRARPRTARRVALAGVTLLALRLVLITASFADYAQDYRRQLAALEHVPRGARVLTFVEHSCQEENWRADRRDHLASLASLYREAWVNDNWAVPGLDMLRPRFRPARYFSADPSEFVWSAGCQGGRLRSVDSALARAPIEMVDFVWLIGTGLPRRPDPRLTLVWQEGRSLLFAVRPLGLNTNPAASALDP